MPQKEKHTQKSRDTKVSQGMNKGAKRMSPRLTEVQKVNLGQGMVRTMFQRRR